MSEELAERCRNADAADRALDGLIYQSLDPVIEKCWPHWNQSQRDEIVPHYTESYDAAMTLLPEGTFVRLNTSIKLAVVSFTHNFSNVYSAKGKTTLGALCAAALLAKIAAAERMASLPQIAMMQALNHGKPKPMKAPRVRSTKAYRIIR